MESKGLFPLALVPVLFTASYLQIAQANTAIIPKAEFERNTQVLVWDVGYHPFVVDRGDVLTDLTKECSVDFDSLDTQEIFRSRKIQADSESNRDLALLLERFGVQAEDFRMNAVTAHLGRPNEPVFFLFPSLYMSDPVKGELGRLHEARALDLLKLTTVLDSQKVMILNMMEGPQGEWSSELKLTPRDLGSRLAEAYKLVAKHWVTSGHLIGEVYGDRVFTQYADRSDLVIQHALLMSAYEMSFEPVPADPGTRWDRAKADLKEKHLSHVRVVNVDTFRAFFEQAVGRPSKDLRAAVGRICRLRAQEMTHYAYDIAKRRGSDVIYMEFGVAHAHDIINDVRKRLSSYIVFSPNFNGLN
jgi:hypothetical protein